jgi:glycosyltransferase
MGKEIYIINYGSNASDYGIGTYIREYIYCLKNIECQVNLIELGINKADLTFSIKEEDGIRRIQIPFSFKDNLKTYSKGICRLLRLYINDSPDLIFHFNYINGDFYIFEIFKNYFPQSKMILTIHYLCLGERFLGNVSLFKRIIKNQNDKLTKERYQDVIDNYTIEKKFIENVDSVICLSKDTFQLVNEEYKIPKRKLHLIPNGLRNNCIKLSHKQRIKIRQRFSIKPDEKILLFVGRVDVIKGIYPLLNCFEKIIREYPECRIVIVGDGDIRGAIKNCTNVWPKVTFTGRLDQIKLYQWYQIADIALFPSFYEECSYVGIEMMMHGLPIIASDGYSVKNMFQEQFNAKIARIENWKKFSKFEKNLTEAILDALNSDLSKLKDEAKKVYELTYNITNMQKKYKQLMDSL